jgi:uncharacterized protein (DUF1697 family)
MTIRVAFLRAVNVGKRTVAMPRLVTLVEGLGHGDVWTHINSGNVVFDAAGARGALEHSLETALEREFGFEVTTMIRTPGEIRTALAEEPFTVAAGDTYFVTFLKDAPTAPEKKQVEALSNDFDTLVVRGRDVHWRMHGKSTDSPLTTRQWSAIVGDRRSTSRNTTILRKLVEKIDARC